MCYQCDTYATTTIIMLIFMMEVVLTKTLQHEITTLVAITLIEYH